MNVSQNNIRNTPLDYSPPFQNIRGNWVLPPRHNDYKGKMKQTFSFNLFADYFQFYIQDETAKGDLNDIWTPDAIDRLLAIAPGIVGIGTVRNMSVPVSVEILDALPTLNSDIYDQIIECSIEITSGKLIIAGCTDYFPDAMRIEVEPNFYRVCVCYMNLNSVSEDSLEGNDQYDIFLWPDPYKDLKILKPRTVR